MPVGSCSRHRAQSLGPPPTYPKPPCDVRLAQFRQTSVPWRSFLRTHWVKGQVRVVHGRARVWNGLWG